MKHIQRGTGYGENGAVTLTGFTDINKMVAIINGSESESPYNSFHLTNLTVDSLSVSHGPGDFSYQVIEYY